MDKIVLRGVKENNLKNIDLTIPRDKFVVFTGLSGSGKSSLAFDTIYAEGQRRYVESLSSYARQFLGQMQKPDVESIDGLSPAISIDQKTTSRNPRSTVGTVTEIYDYLRLLFANVGIAHCPKCGRRIDKESIDSMVDRVMALDEGTKFLLLAPVIRGKKGEHVKVFEKARKDGFVRVVVDGETRDLSEDILLEKTKKHNIEIVVDRLIAKPDMGSRLSDSLETAMKLAEGICYVDVIGGERMLLSENYACPECGIAIEELAPRMFSFNTPYGSCPDCTGLGFLQKVDPEKIIRDREKNVFEGAIGAPGWNPSSDDGFNTMYYRGIAKHFGFDLSIPLKDWPKEALHTLLFGTNVPIRFEYDRAYASGSFDRRFEGIIPNMERRYADTNSDVVKAQIESMMSITPCASCGGKRLRKESLAVTVADKNIAEVTDMPVEKLISFFSALSLTETEKIIAGGILKEIRARLSFLSNVGLEYLTLSRAAGTLSGGEAQRIRLATQVGSGLVGVLYILDEPSIGLHQRDNTKLIASLKQLRDLGNSLIVVEHDEETMESADYIVDIGPGAGVHGGEIVAAGTVEEIKACETSLTGAYLSGRMSIPVPKTRAIGNGHALVLKGAAQNNLKNIDVTFPLGKMIAVTGVSGSGKSSLINGILYKILARDLNRAQSEIPGKYESISGLEHLDKVICIDQSPIGRTPRSNPATYTGVFGDIRNLFAATAEAKARGYSAGRFSFNVKGGRCEACAGDGILKIEMHFLADVYVPCDVCKGKRFNRETLEVRYKGKNIYEVLDMTVEEGLHFFEALPQIKRKLQALYDVGLGYIKIGQSSTTLSGGEAQRVKLATELSKRGNDKTIYILDEPTTGLHTADVHRLLDVLRRFVEIGSTVLVIEHNLDVIKTADHIIDLGPEGGDRGGTIMAVGTPEEVAQVKDSYTGQYLKKVLEK